MLIDKLEAKTSLDTKKVTPSVQFYSNLQQAFDYFNERLFDDQLPPFMLTLRSSNRIYGYHHVDRFISKEGQLLDELGFHLPGRSYFKADIGPMRLELTL